MASFTPDVVRQGLGRLLSGDESLRCACVALEREPWADLVWAMAHVAPLVRDEARKAPVWWVGLTDESVLACRIGARSLKETHRVAIEAQHRLALARVRASKPKGRIARHQVTLKMNVGGVKLSLLFLAEAMDGNLQQAEELIGQVRGV